MCLFTLSTAQKLKLYSRLRTRQKRLKSMIEDIRESNSSLKRYFRACDPPTEVQRARLIPLPTLLDRFRDCLQALYIVIAGGWWCNGSHYANILLEKTNTETALPKITRTDLEPLNVFRVIFRAAGETSPLELVKEISISIFDQKTIFPDDLCLRSSTSVSKVNFAPSFKTQTSLTSAIK
jgi:hypothetical protein